MHIAVMLSRTVVVSNEISNYINLIDETSCGAEEKTAIRTTCWRINFDQHMRRERKMTAELASAAKDSNTKPLLDEEISYYESRKEELIRDHINRYLLIKGSKLIGSFETRGLAIAEGYRLYGTGPFLVRLTGEDTPVGYVPALALGIPLCQ